MHSQPITAEQSEYLLRVMEGAPQVCRRHQFFVWCQGDLQRWLPHHVAVCGTYDRELRALSFDLFNSLPMPSEVIIGLLDAHSALLVAALEAWQTARQQPTRVSVSELAGTRGCEVSRRLIESGYREALVHGTTRPGRPDELESLFLFMRHEGVYTDANAAAFSMLLPCLHLTYQRVAVTERMLNPAGRATTLRPGLVATPGVERSPAITEREREILRWVREGLSNQQIGEQLGISALTVKNHVQKILRKLGATNRTQAVAKVMSMHSLSPSTGP